MSETTPPRPAPTAAVSKRRPGTLATLAIDYGPLVLFFIANFRAPVPDALKIFFATGVFMAAMIAAMLFSQLRYGRISPMLWFSGIMVVVFGGLTIWLHDQTFIQIKPTIYYATVSGLLFFGMRTGRNLLKVVLGTAYPGLSERGWHLLTRNWIVFFLVLAAANEAIRLTLTIDVWAALKLWLFVPSTLIFIVANVPMLLKHGLTLEEAEKPPEVPVE